MLAGLQAGHVQAATDRKLAGAAEAGRAVALLTLDAIHPRADDTRPARADHVLALAESVAAVGLLQPPAVDKEHRLIAGLNRLEACKLLLTAPAGRGAVLEALDGAGKLDPKETKDRLNALPEPAKLPEPLKSGKLPVRVLTELDAQADPDAALAAEAAENTARKSYTPAEVAAPAIGKPGDAPERGTRPCALPLGWCWDARLTPPAGCWGQRKVGTCLPFQTPPNGCTARPKPCALPARPTWTPLPKWP
jgi:hypothetical protein